MAEVKTIRGLLANIEAPKKSIEDRQQKIDEMQKWLENANNEILRIGSGQLTTEPDKFSASLNALCDRLGISTLKNESAFLDGSTLWFALICKLLPTQPEFKPKARRGPKGKSDNEKVDYARYRAIKHVRMNSPQYANLTDIEIAHMLGEQKHELFSFRLGDETIAPSLSRGKAIWDEATRKGLALHDEIRRSKSELEMLKIDAVRAKPIEPLSLLSGIKQPLG